MSTTRPAPRPPLDGNSARHRALLVLLTVLVAVIGLAAPTASAQPAIRAGNAVAAINPGSATPVGAVAAISPGHIRGESPLFDDRTVVSLVTPRGAGAADDIVRYDPQWASRQLLGQNVPGSSGWAVTPGGRTLSAHAAERVALGGAGRPPTSLSMVDDILGSGTRVIYDPTRNTIRVIAEKMPGKPYVVVSARDPNHVVTVMAPYG